VAKKGRDQLATLTTLASDHLAAHLDRLLTTLQSDAVLLPTRRHLAHGVRPTLHQGARRLEAILSGWDEMLDEVGRLVATYGPEVLRQIEARDVIPDQDARS